MIYFAKWKVVLVLLVCALGVIYAAPNLVDRQAMTEWSADVPGWLPVRQVNLGLDLQGGTHLLARVEYREVVTKRIESLESSIRRPLREADIGRRGGIGVEGDAVVFTLRDPADADRLRDLVTEQDPSFVADFDPATGAVAIHFTPEAIEELRGYALSQSIEIIRKRIDELGTTEPNIQRQGDDRILIQVPGEGDSQHENPPAAAVSLLFHPEDGSEHPEVGGD